jgi:hypothetical protein
VNPRVRGRTDYTVQLYQYGNGEPARARKNLFAERLIALDECPAQSRTAKKIMLPSQE